MRKISANDKAEELKKVHGVAGALSLAEGLLKQKEKLGWTYSDLPDLRRIAAESWVSPSMQKQLIKMSEKQIQEVVSTENFWTQVANILRKQMKQ